MVSSSKEALFTLRYLCDQRHLLCKHGCACSLLAAAAAAAAAVLIFPVEMRTVDGNTSALIEFKDGDTVSYVRYERTMSFSGLPEPLPYVTIPFGLMNMSIPLGTFLEILSLSSEGISKYEQHDQAFNLGRNFKRSNESST